MRITFKILSAFSLCLLAACTSTPTSSSRAAPTQFIPPTMVAPNGYRPVQEGDIVEDVRISYQYVLPSLDRPVVTVALSINVLQFVSIKPEMKDGFVEYIEEIRALLKQGKSVYGFDENDLKQTEPQLITFDASKPVELVFIPIEPGARRWNVTELFGTDTYAAFKIIHRKDGGLRFVDAYAQDALFSANNLFTQNGGGTGLVFSSRVALLKLILSDSKYQRGTDVFAANPVDYKAYDPRVLKIDPSREGLAQNRDWVIVSRPGPNPGLQGP